MKEIYGVSSKKMAATAMARENSVSGGVENERK